MFNKGKKQVWCQPDAKQKRRKAKEVIGSTSSKKGIATKLSAIMPNSPAAICPSKMIQRLKYQRVATLNSGANSYAFANYSLNSCFDPLYDVGGGRCSGFDAWMALYTRYFVRSVRVSQQMVNGGNTIVLSYLLPLRSADAASGAVVPTTDYVMESRDARFMFMNINSSIPNGWCLTVELNPTSFEGLPEGSNREELSGDSTSDPVIQPAIQCGYVCPTGTVGVSLVPIIKVEYLVEFWRPRLVGDA